MASVTAADVLIKTIADWGVDTIFDLHPIDFAESFAKGEPNREKIALTVLAAAVRGLV